MSVRFTARGQELGNCRVYLMRVRVNVSSYLMGPAKRGPHPCEQPRLILQWKGEKKISKENNLRK